MLFPVISAVFQVFFDSYRVLFTSSQAWWWYQASIPITSWIWTFFSTLHCSIFFMRFFHHKQKKTRCWTTRSEEYTMILRLSWFEFANFSCFAYHEECVKSMFFHPCLILRALMKNVGGRWHISVIKSWSSWVQYFFEKKQVSETSNGGLNHV